MSEAKDPRDVVNLDVFSEEPTVLGSTIPTVIPEIFDLRGPHEGNEHLIGLEIGDRPTADMIEDSKLHEMPVLEKYGSIVAKLPGKHLLKSVGLSKYKDQVVAALRNPVIRALRRKVDNLTKKGRQRQDVLEKNHALKLRLGSNWTRFYLSLLAGQDSIANYLYERNQLTDEALDNIIKNTGWIFGKYTAVPVYEQLIQQESKHAKSNKGGLYKLILEVAPDDHRPFFAKKHGKRKEYERTLRVQPELAKLTMGKVSPILAKDDYNEITVEQFIHGETLTSEFSNMKLMRKHPVLQNKKAVTYSENQNRLKKEKLIGALEELVDISRIATGNRQAFNGLDTTGKGGKSFKKVFEDKYAEKVTRDLNIDEFEQQQLGITFDPKKTLIELIEKHITSVLDDEKTVFCHGDAHTDNVLELFINDTGRKNKYKWIDWEYAQFSIPQLDLVKLLKKANINSETEEEIVKHYYNLISFRRADEEEITHSWGDVAYDKDYKHFRKVYNKMKIFDYLTSAAKYNELAKDSKEHKDEVQAQAWVYFTRALEMINQDETIDEKDRFKLTKALVTASKGKLEQLIDGDLEAIEKELNPLNNQSIVNFGSSILSKYNQPPLGERVRDWLKKYKRLLGAGVFMTLVSTAGLLVNNEIEIRDARLQEQTTRTSNYLVMTDSNEKLMPFVSEYAAKYDDVSETELAAVINASFNYNKQLIEELKDPEKYPDRFIRDMVRQTRRELDLMQKGLSLRQAFVKKEHLENPENNVYSAAKRLHDMKEIFESIEDVYLAFFTSPEFVKKWKKKASNYWDYSKDPDFEHESEFPGNYKKLTDMAIAYTPKNEKD